MIRTKTELIKKIRKIAFQRYEQAHLILCLAGSIEQDKNNKTVKEWVDFVGDSKVFRKIQGGNE